ncbi:RHS repeat-associated core domain-containing protein, partial [Sulfuricella sp. T08]|uniref:RHS repeat-associated core domain-containing protein n=1 Tax=Sulfuricella sp. T08 TaxID=1632857 RepID=UPI000AC1A194
QDIYAEYGAAWTNPNAVYTSGGGVDDPVIKATVTGSSTYGQASYYHADGLGSIVGLSNSTDSTTQTERFDAWGNKLAGTIPQGAQYGFTGREGDETGIVYYRARYLDPAIGRFASRDPIGLKGGINQYTYVNNNPVNFNDPTGLLAKVLLADATSAISYAGNVLTDAGQNLQAFGQRVLDAGRNESFADTANKLLQGLGPEVAMVGAAVGSIKGVAAGENLVYRSVNAAGEVNYVGITNNLERRAAEQLSSKGISIEPILGLSNLSRADVKGVEQVLIESHGLSKDGGTLMNKINSIAPLNAIYEGAKQRGADLLKLIGYPGF